MQKWFSSDHEFVASVAERAQAAKKEKLERYFRQGEFKLGEHVRVRMASLYSNLRARIKAGIMKKTIVTYSHRVPSGRGVRAGAWPHGVQFVHFERPQREADH